MLPIALPLPELPTSFYPNLCTAGPPWFPQCIWPPWPAACPDQRHTPPSDSSVQGKWGFVLYQGRTVHLLPLYAYKVAMLIARSKCQSSTLPARALRKSLDGATLAQLSRGFLLQEDTPAQTSLPSAKQRWYLIAAFLNVKHLLCLSYLFHPCEKFSMTCSAVPLDVLVTESLQLGQTSGHHFT